VQTYLYLMFCYFVTRNYGSQWYVRTRLSMGTEGTSGGLKWPRGKADDFPLSSAEVEMTPTLSHVFLAICFAKYKDNFEILRL
jgi:hypothetical protein